MTAIGLGIGLAFQQGGGGGGFSPSSLYASGEEGAVYDPSDLSTLWKDEAGTMAVTTDGDVVARMDDLSGNGWNVTESNATYRPTYKTDGTYHWLESSNHRLVAGSSAAAFKFLHDGTGAMIAYAGQWGVGSTPTAIGGICGTGETATSVIGGYFGRTDAVWRTQITSGTANAILDTTASPPVAQSPYHCRLEYLTQAGDDFEVIVEGTSAHTKAESSTPSSSSATYDFVVLAGNNGGAAPRRPWIGKFYGMIVRDAIPTTEEATNIDAWLAERHS